MLIGQFGETYPPALDGVGRVMLSYCQTLEKKGHRALYIAPENPAFPADDQCECLLYRGIGIPGEPYRIGIPALSKVYRQGIKRLDFDVVHAHSPFLAGRAARRIAKRRNIPLVSTFHSKYYDDFYRATHSKLLARLALRYVLAFYRTCDEVWAVNAKTADVLRSYGFQGEIIVMPNGTDLQTVPEPVYQKALEAFPLREGIPTLLFVGQQDFKKNTHSILKACGLLKNRGMDFQLIMAGTGQDLQRLKDMTRELGLEKQVLFTGFLSDRNTLLSLHRRADLFVFPSIYDNAPMVVREAAIMGTPSLLVEGTCAAEGITHGVNGFLCRNSPESIADGIQAALPVAHQVGLEAQKTIPVPWNQILDGVLGRYQALITAKAAKGASHEAIRP